MSEAGFDLSNESVLDQEHHVNQVFEIAKQEIEIMSEQEAKMVVVAKMNKLLPESKFQGLISVTERIKKGEATAEGITQARTFVEKSYVSVTKGAGLRCVDGRGEEGYDDNDPAWYELGPQIQGATVDVAVARRLRQGVSSGSETLQADVAKTVQETTNDFAPSAHTDDHEHEAGKCGCGAINGQETKLDYYLDPEVAAAIPGVVGAIYGLADKELPGNALADLVENATALKGIKADYFGNKPDAFTYLGEFNQNAKKVVTGKHNEFELVLNFVSGTTLNSGKLNTLTNGEYNAFGLDVWYILENFGDDAPYILADALATVLNLTDGSLDVRARVANEQFAQAA